MGKLLTRKDVLSKNRLKMELVEVPEWEGDVYIRELSQGQLLEYNEHLHKISEKNPEITPSASLELMALLVFYSVCDEQGNPLFAEDDVKDLANSNLNVLLTLSTKIMKLSGVSGEAIDEVAANLKNAQSDSSATDLPTNSDAPSVTS